MNDKKVYISGNICVDITIGTNGIIVACAEEDKVTALRLGLEINCLYKSRTFYVWNDSGYAYAYSHPTGKPPSFQSVHERIN